MKYIKGTRTIFKSMISYEDAASKAVNAGYPYIVGKGKNRDGSFVVFAQNIISKFG
jgi:hypothetical protein